MPIAAEAYGTGWLAQNSPPPTVARSKGSPGGKPVGVGTSTPMCSPLLRYGSLGKPRGYTVEPYGLSYTFGATSIGAGKRSPQPSDGTALPRASPVTTNHDRGRKTAAIPAPTDGRIEPAQRSDNSPGNVPASTATMEDQRFHSCRPTSCAPADSPNPATATETAIALRTTD